MASFKILVLGATGPAGICVLREALFRSIPTVAYVRNASKLPSELCQNPLLEVIEGPMEDTEGLSLAISKATVIISLLGPGPKVPPSGEHPFADYYSAIFPLMRSHSVKRILAMGTLGIREKDDKSSFMVSLMNVGVRYGVPAAYRAIQNIHHVFKKEADGLDWTIFRLGMVQGGGDENSWEKDRLHGTYAGHVGGSGWTWYIKRGGLAKWLVDQAEAERGVAEYLPAVSYYQA